MQVQQGRRGILDDEQLERLAATLTPAADNDNLTLFNEHCTRRDRTGETRRTLSWIWTTSSNIVGPEDSSDDILHAEWAKSQAQAARATEEVILLWEEMRQVLEFLAWRADWWTKRLDWRGVTSKDLMEGLHAYAHSQADLQTTLSAKFRTIWRAPLDDASRADDPTGEDDPNASDSEDGDEGDDPVADDDEDDNEDMAEI